MLPASATAHYRKVKLTAAIGPLGRMDAEAHIPGEIAGPALSFKLTLTNAGSSTIGVTSHVAVTVSDARGVPLSPLTTSTTAVNGTLHSGQHVAGTYAFHLPSGFHNPVTIEVSYAATAEVARFVGSVS